MIMKQMNVSIIVIRKLYLQSQNLNYKIFYPNDISASSSIFLAERTKIMKENIEAIEIGVNIITLFLASYLSKIFFLIAIKLKI